MPIPTLPFTTLYGSAGKHQQLSKCGEALHRSWYQRGSMRPVLNGTSDPLAPVHLSPTKLQTHRTYCYGVYQHRLTHPIKTDITLNSRNTCLNPATLRWATNKALLWWSIEQKIIFMHIPLPETVGNVCFCRTETQLEAKCERPKIKQERDSIRGENTLEKEWVTKPKTQW